METLMIETLKRIADAQEGQAAEWKQVKNELCEIRESIKRIHAKLDDTAERTIINTEKISTLKEMFEAEKKETDTQLTIVHKSIRRRDTNLRWVYSGIVIPIILALVAIFKPH